MYRYGGGDVPKTPVVLRTKLQLGSGSRLIVRREPSEPTGWTITHPVSSWKFLPPLTLVLLGLGVMLSGFLRWRWRRRCRRLAHMLHAV